MSKLGISEFTFGFAFLRELANMKFGQLRAAPILPSLKGEKQLGWDAHLPLACTDYYFQFKKADYFAHKNSKFISNGTYSEPYFRFQLHNADENLQHRLLWKLSQSSPDTYYVVPTFPSKSHFDAAFILETVVKESKWIPLAGCAPHNDSMQHSITFQKASSTWLEHSRPTEHVGARGGADLTNVLLESEPRWKTLDEGFASEIFEKVRATALELRPDLQPGIRNVDTLGSLLNGGVSNWSRTDLLDRAAALAAAALGATLVLVGLKQEPES